ncbi:MAG TPA: hypothetical protein HA353_05780 [Candidatus Poseidonia sp.]|nr:hypothetical protein [Poseidonia sp.]
MAPTRAFRATADDPEIIQEQKNDDEGDIPPPVKAEPDGPPQVRQQEPKPVLIGWLDSTGKVADVEGEFVLREDDQNAVPARIGWLDDID